LHDRVADAPIGDQMLQLEGKTTSFQSQTAALEPLLQTTLTPDFLDRQENNLKKTT
jgi:hypothetical protein